ncbi:MAG: tetratricopeptide repeat protein [Lachnospiraceae bacterium]|jgi:tetratricopeptide (TPR) repeat protein|nr:tetratricopeptide repeat protein [Lachnospiraceae bacterium]
MKKKGICRVFFPLVLLGLLVCSGCGSRSAQSLEQELAYRKQGIEKMKEGSYEEAVKLFQNALDQSLAVIGQPEIDICYYKAAGQYKSGDEKGAIETCTALINYDKDNVDAYYLRGTLYLVQGEAEKAGKDYQEALELEPKNIKLHNRIGENLQNAGQEEKAGIILNQALGINGTEASDYREKGYSCYLLGQYDSARTYLDKAMNMEDKEAVLYMAMLLEAQGETEQANRLYENYGSQERGSTESLGDKGFDKMKEGDYKEALDLFEEALKEEGNEQEQEIRKNEIIALENLHEFQKAKEKMEAYVKDYPQDADAAREYEFLKSR